MTNGSKISFSIATAMTLMTMYVRRGRNSALRKSYAISVDKGLLVDYGTDGVHALTFDPIYPDPRRPTIPLTFDKIYFLTVSKTPVYK